MKKLIFSLLLAAGGSYIANAQQDAMYNMYLFNGLYLNPAYAGSNEVANVVAVFRNQWTGLDGAPRTVNISADAPLRRDQYALGVNISNDRLGLTNMFSANGSFAYRIKIKGENIIALGLQAGVTYYQQRNTEAITVDPSTLTTNYDPTFSVNQNLWLPNVGAGVYAYGKKYFVGFSVPHLVPFSLDRKWTLATTSSVAHQYNQYLFTGGYVFGKDASIVKFRPSFLLKYQQGLRYNVPDFDFNAGLLFIDRIWLIAGVQTGGEANNVLGTNTDPANAKKFGLEGIIGMVQAKLTPQLSVGYAYHYSLSGIRAYETGTHEVMVGYQFWYNKKRFVTPRYVKYF
jgi:type IX secretion system PorP/SprF family membrane protein